MSDELPSPAFRRRPLYGLVAGLALALPLAAVAYPLGLFDVNPDVDASAFHVILPLLGESAAAGVVGGLMGAVTRWFWGTGVVGAAVTSGVGAAGVAAMITFGLLAATLVPGAQIAWIVLLGGVVGWSSLLTDRHQEA